MPEITHVIVHLMNYTICILSIMQKTYLRSYIVRCATESCGGHSIQNPFFTHPKVSQFTVAFCIQKNIVQFQVPEIKRPRIISTFKFWACTHEFEQTVKHPNRWFYKHHWVSDLWVCMKNEWQHLLNRSQ